MTDSEHETMPVLTLLQAAGTFWQPTRTEWMRASDVDKARSVVVTPESMREVLRDKAICSFTFLSGVTTALFSHGARGRSTLNPHRESLLFNSLQRQSVLSYRPQSQPLHCCTPDTQPPSNPKQKRKHGLQIHRVPLRPQIPLVHSLH